jgi:CheY-like chemotaxis protein
MVQNVADIAAELRRYPAHAVLVTDSLQEGMTALMEQAQRQSGSTPVVGCVLSHGAERVSAAGAAGYLTKPVSRATLVDAIEALGVPARRVLIVDDDPDVVRLFARMLQAEDPDVTVRGAYSGREALEQAVEGDIDLVLLDVVMPDMDGWEVLARLRREPRCNAVSVLLISAQDLVDRPLGSNVLAVSHGQSLSVRQIIECALGLTEILLAPGDRGRRAH